MKAPTKHGLDRKFKSWRKGKSQKANKKGSLKQQLRGHQRLLSKLSEEEADRRKELEDKIRQLQSEISQKNQSLQEKKNAERAHGPRFLDRQRLTRKEKQERNNTKNESNLLKLALDQVYVAHHPNDIKYMPLFQKGQRVVDQSRQLYRRAVTRKRILKLLASSSPPSHCNWIARDQYERLPKDWTIQDEENMFGGSVSRKQLKQKVASQTDDSRFALDSNHEALLQAADQLESHLKEQDNNTDGQSSSSNSDIDNVNDTNTLQVNDEKALLSDDENEVEVIGESSDSSNDSSDDSDSDSDEEEELKESEQSKSNAKVSHDDLDDDSSSDGSSSSSDSDDSDDDNDEKVKDQPKPTSFYLDDKEEEEVDDFLLDDDENDDTNVFQNTSAQLPGLAQRGDKSKGWETQRQRPGQFKKRRMRR